MRSVAIGSAALFVVVGAGCGGTSERPPATPEPEAESEPPGYESRIEELAKPLVEDDWLAGLAVGWFAEGERGVLGMGTTELGTETTPDGDTLFEIGSATKLFTGIALAAMVERGEVELDTPVDELLPEVDVPSYEGEAITLEHLATHRSGLPRLPDNLSPSGNPDEADDPYADYGREELAAFLKDYELTRAPGAKFEYSNLGAGLLGEALAARAEMSYEELVAKLVLDPLAMEDTAIRLSEEQARRLAEGHAEGEPVPPWSFDALAGAGALRSPVEDLLTFIEAHISDAPEPVAGALAAATEARAEIPVAEAIGLGWHIGLEERGGTARALWHNGGTGGFHSFVAFDPDREVGVVVLTNSMQPAIERLGVAVLRLLRDEPANFELPRLASVDRETLDRYEGVYQLAPGMRIEVVREGERLLAQVTGQPQVPIYPSSKREFHYRVVDARITFELDESGEVAGLTLRQEGETYEADKVEGESPRKPDIVEVEVEEEVIERYEGVYQLGSDTTLEVELEEEGLTAQITGQPPLLIVPISETEFVYRDVNAQITFELGEEGEVGGLTLRQAGQEHEAPKVE